ncbi:MAG: hypothetical protein ACRC67_30295 [Inquilinus sp.]|uniref:hypothetical protein n=1 Tax=Inquilinus sp. TaxID=1932117 RepID=UPI003F29F6FC
MERQFDAIRLPKPLEDEVEEPLCVLEGSVIATDLVHAPPPEGLASAFRLEPATDHELTLGTRFP